MNIVMRFLGAFMLSFLVACGGGPGPTPTPPPVNTTYSISGSTTPGATLSLNGQATSSTVADATGVYSFAGLANGNYSVTPSLPNYSFAPSSLAVVVNGADVTNVTFAGTLNSTPMYTISGSVSGLSSGVTMSLDTGASTLTDATASYSFTGLIDGRYTVTPLYPGYSFAPVSMVVDVAGTNRMGINFVATANPAPTYCASGNVSGRVSSGVTITATPGGLNTTSGANGNYSLCGLADGTYTLKATKTGDTLTAPDVSVTISGANSTGNDFVEPVPMLNTGKTFYPGEDAALIAANSGDGAIYSQDLAAGTTTRLWGGYQCPPGGCAIMLPDIIVPVRAVGSVVFKGSNIPCLVIMPLSTLTETCVTPTGATAIAVMGSFDATQNGDLVVLAQGDNASSPYKQNISVYRADGSWVYFFVTSGPDIDSSPVFASTGGKTSTAVTILFVRNHTEIRQQIVDVTTGSPVGASTVFATNVVDGAVRAMSVNAAYTHVAFTRSVGGVTHIFVKPLAGGAEVDIGAGTDPYWATNGSDLIKYTANNALWAMKSDGTGKVQIPTPSNLAINGFRGAGCGDFCLGNVTIAPAWY